jgi:PAS domain S-box-containing protein
MPSGNGIHVRFGAKDPETQFPAIEASCPVSIGLLDSLPLEAEDLFASAWDSWPTGALVIGAGDRIVLVNRELERQFGYSRRELLGGPIALLFPDGLPAARALDRPDVSGVARSGAIAGGRELSGLRRDGSRVPLEVRLNPIDTARGVLVLASVVDGSRCRATERLHGENLYLRHKAEERQGASTIVGQSPAIRRVLEQIQKVAATDSTVLLLGETGTGKELFATHIHQLSARSGRAMVRVNCSAIPTTLMESELFGREKGAFTGALSKQVGRFELADHSTIFLDEIGDLPLEVQVKLLRVLEERQIERLGSPRGIRVDTRIVAATHRKLEQRIADGNFREDLFYRLNVFPITVPPLRERVEDIPLLVWRFVDEFSKAFGKRVDSIPRDTMEALQRYSWPGNIRELRNLVERAMIVATGAKLTIAVPSSASTGRSERLFDVEREHIRSVLETVGWRIRGTSGAADRLGMKPTTLETRMARLGLNRPKRQ